MVSDLLPPVDLTELLFEINVHTGSADEFFHACEASAVLVSEACNIGLE